MVGAGGVLQLLYIKAYSLHVIWQIRRNSMAELSISPALDLKPQLRSVCVSFYCAGTNVSKFSIHYPLSRADHMHIVLVPAALSPPGCWRSSQRDLLEIGTEPSHPRHLPVKRVLPATSLPSSICLCSSSGNMLTTSASTKGASTCPIVLGFNMASSYPIVMREFRVTYRTRKLELNVSIWPSMLCDARLTVT